MANLEQTPSGSANRAYWAAVACGALPLVVGTSIFLLWLAVRWDWLAWAGLLTIYAGTAMVLVGAIALGMHVWTARREGVSPRRLWLSSAACGALLLVNFPAAGAIVLVALRAQISKHMIIVHNDSPHHLHSVLAQGGGNAIDLGPVAPNDVAVGQLPVEQDGPLRLRARSEAIVVEQVIGDVLEGSPDETEVRIGADGKISKMTFMD